MDGQLILRKVRKEEMRDILCLLVGYSSETRPSPG